MSGMNTGTRFFSNGLLLHAAMALVLMTAAGVQATYYVDASGGNDGNAGTSPGAAFSSIAKVNTLTLQPGDSVLFAGGQTFAGMLNFTAADSGTPAAPVVVGSYGTGRATIDAGDTTGIRWNDCGGVVVQDLVITGSGQYVNLGSGIVIMNTRPSGDKREYVRVTNVTAKNFGGIRKDYRGNGIWIGGEASDGSKSGFRNVRVEACTTHTCQINGIWVSGYWHDEPTEYANENVVVNSCVAYNVVGCSTYTSGWSGNGIFVEDCDRGRIEYCLSYNNGSHCAGNAGPSGIWTAVSRDFCIQYCETYGNDAWNSDGDGFDLDNGCINDTIQYCYSHDNKGAGYLICTGDINWSPWINENLVVRYNISENDGRNPKYAGIHIGTGSDTVRNIEIYNNTVVSTQAGYGPAFIADAWNASKYNWSGISIRNNIFYSTQDVIEIWDNIRTTKIKFEGNSYHTTASFSIKDNGTSYATLPAWRSARSQEKIGTVDVGLSGDPMLTDPGNGGTLNTLGDFNGLTAYQLQDGSPLIDTGLDLSARYGIDMGGLDLYGIDLPVNGVYDVGAMEWTGDVPVELSSFTAAAAGDTVLLAWSTATENRNMGFNVQRSAAADGPFTTVNSSLIPGHGTTAVPQQYAYADADAGTGTWYYRLEQVDSSGAKTLSYIVSATVDPVSSVAIGPRRISAGSTRSMHIFDQAGRSVPGLHGAPAGVYVVLEGGRMRKVLVTE